MVAEPQRLRLHVQPVAETAQSSIAGNEALSRFDGPFTHPRTAGSQPRRSGG